MRRRGSQADEALVLGLLASRVLDWYVRHIIENDFTRDFLYSIPVPRPPSSTGGYRRVVDIAGRLAAVDERYAAWAAEVGVPVGSVTSQEEKDDLIAQLDACVARLYGLTEDELVHVFETFHHGWDYRPRLERVLGHFRKLDFDPAPTADGGAS